MTPNPTTTRYVPKGRYVTVSLRPATHARLLGMLNPRETMDELVCRLADAYPHALEFQRLYTEAR